MMFDAVGSEHVIGERSGATLQIFPLSLSLSPSLSLYLPLSICLHTEPTYCVKASAELTPVSLFFHIQQSGNMLAALPNHLHGLAHQVGSIAFGGHGAVAVQA